MADLLFEGGVTKESTPYSVGGSFVDSNLIRSRNGRLSSIGGWYQRQTNQNLAGVCRCIKEFSNNQGVNIVAFGTNTNVYVLSGDTVYDITPAGFIAGNANAVIADGYGIGTYGSGTYGTPRTPDSDPFSQVILQPLIWSIDNFGENLILCPYAGVSQPGPIYVWNSDGGFGQLATLLSADPDANSVPIYARGAFVSQQAECVVALGCNPFGSTSPDPMQIRWSDFGNYDLWYPTSANNSGGYRLPSGSYIVGWLNTYYETLIFTDTTVYSMQLTGNSLDFAFPAIATGMTMISPRAAVSNGVQTFWMDNGTFYVYAGSTQELPCSIKFFIFGDGNTKGDLNRQQAFKCYAALNHSYSEVMWFYPSNSGTGEIDSYAMYNYRDSVWLNGKLPRTAWSDSGHLDTPIAVDPSGIVYMQDYGCDAKTGTGPNTTTALPWSLTTGDLAIEQGDVYTLLQRIIPDFNFNGTGGTNQQIMLDIRVRESSNETPRVVATYQINPTANNRGVIDKRVRGRRISFRFYSAGVPGCAWTLGKLQVQFTPNGSR